MNTWRTLKTVGRARPSSNRQSRGGEKTKDRIINPDKKKKAWVDDNQFLSEMNCDSHSLTLTSLEREKQHNMSARPQGFSN